MDKGFVQLGNTRLDLTEVAGDIRGIEDMLKEVIENDWSENHYLQFSGRLTPFAEAEDIAEWDTILLDKHPPLYTRPRKICDECYLGSCDLEKDKGKCGIEFEAHQARLSLREACAGCLQQMIECRTLLDYAIKSFGTEKPASMGDRATVVSAEGSAT